MNDIEDIQHPAIRNAMKMLDMHEIRLTYEADLPARFGLGTSSSFTVGMLNVMNATVVARASGIKVVGLTGAKGGELFTVADVCV